MRACPHCLTVYESDPEFCAFDGTRTVTFAANDDPLAGLELDGYRLEARLGVGGTGCVYRGRRITSGETVAIKLLFGEMATDRGIAERFRREATAMQAIDHPNVVKVIDCKTSSAGVTYLAMEYVEGQTLKEVVEREAPLAPGRVGRLAEHLVAGMAQAHRVGYVHRDLKPSNVMVSGPPGGEVAKILDFGIVASLHESETDSRLTKTGYIVGTPTYMAPEQVDPKSVTPQADVYALGVMIYEMLAGKPPFTGTLEQILVAKMTTKPAPLTHVGELGELVTRLLATDPEDRPPTALHVSAELARMSLLSADPATEKARVPDLAPLGTVGFGQATVVLIDRTDENPLPEDEPQGTGDLRTDATPAPPQFSLHQSTEESPDPRGVSVSDPGLTAPDGYDSPLEQETPDDGYPSFSEEAQTYATLRPDTIVEPNPLDVPSEPEIDAAQFGDTSSPTSPEHDHDATFDDALSPDIPTRLTSLDAQRMRPASAASGPFDITAEDEGASTGSDLAFTEEHVPARDSVDDTALLAAVDDDTDDDEPADEELGFADTRIRPAHARDGSDPDWGAPVLEPPPLMPAEEVAATAFDPAAGRPAASTDLLSDDGAFIDPAELGDDPTALSSLLPDPDDDPGDGDTALDFSLDQIGAARTDLDLEDAAARATAGFVDPSPPTAQLPAPPAPPALRGWLLGLVVAGTLLATAAITYFVIDATETIEVPTVPQTPSSP